MRRFLLSAAAATAFAGGIAAGLLLRPEPTTLEAGTLLEPARAVAPFSLAATGPDALDNAALAGKWSLVFFGFTRCPDICPNTLQLLSAARDRIIEAGKPAPRIVLVTVDPEHDDVGRLADYVAYFGEGIVGATGSPGAIAEVARDLGIVYTRVPLDDGGYTMDHSATVLLLDPAVALRAVFTPPLRVPALADDLVTIMAAGS